MKSKRHIPIATFTEIWNDCHHYYPNYYLFYNTNKHWIKQGNSCLHLHYVLKLISEKSKVTPNCFCWFVILMAQTIEKLCFEKYLEVKLTFCLAVSLYLNWCICQTDQDVIFTSSKKKTATLSDNIYCNRQYDVISK